ncbi:WXG100 family type VII secretion target [Actinotignum urinale]|uniref:WXG100 family type VII secretion target n=1 Tax=Actinotignum urinale TaxID=190146 RepID=UPI002A81A2CA|nr:WXG100 family type VII secretion target [Actinotignum urinale]MDY5151315.1 WXG100 family type VII secretion target [Actinotignum urinale]
MSTHMAVNFGQMSQGSAIIAQHSNSIMDCLERLNAQIRGAIVGWDGQAQAAYEASYGRWRSVANELNAIYAGMGKQVQESADAYLAADRAAALLLS